MNEKRKSAQGKMNQATKGRGTNQVNNTSTKKKKERKDAMNPLALPRGNLSEAGVTITQNVSQRNVVGVCDTGRKQRTKGSLGMTTPNVARKLMVK